MVLVNINYPEKGCSTPCPAMRCQKCIISESKNVLDFLKKDREKNKPDWCPIVAPINFGEECIPPDPIKNYDKSMFKACIKTATGCNEFKPQAES